MRDEKSPARRRAEWLAHLVLGAMVEEPQLASALATVPRPIMARALAKATERLQKACEEQREGPAPAPSPRGSAPALRLVPPKCPACSDRGTSQVDGCASCGRKERDG